MTVEVREDTETSYRVFDVMVVRIRSLSPSFVRLTFGGSDLASFADHGFDQRIKLVLPLPDSGLQHFPRQGDWYSSWRELPAAHQNPIRTYTVRAVRRDPDEIDVDLVRHGDSGPASRWAGAVSLGDEILVVGPNRRFVGPVSAYEWRPAAGVRHFLIGADETAVPAAASILERLPADSAGVAVLEVPRALDFLPLEAPDGIRIEWRVTVGGHGSALQTGVRQAAETLLRNGSRAELDDLDVDGIVWDVPLDPATGGRDGLFVWLAGEASTVVALRRHLVRERGLNRNAVAFMGYWRAGRPGS